ncbi:MAG: DUF2162 domain-containing protein [Methanotrichaceae archaeon]|nr:DUF2162 domain-containing protein [Methanotrichaceae archaeon]
MPSLDSTWLSASGVLIGILIFAFKVSLGSGLASLNRNEVYTIAAGYLVISSIMGMAIGVIPEDMLGVALDAGVSMHIAIALLLVTMGVITARNWNHHHHDVSRKTFWILSIPCPACLAASFISCSYLSELLEIAPWKVGVLVGSFFSVGIIAFSSALGRKRRSPSSMGSAMIFLGLFYILSILLIPAYLDFQKISIVSMSMPAADMLYSYLMIFSLVALGFVGRMRGVSL